MGCLCNTVSYCLYKTYAVGTHLNCRDLSRHLQDEGIQTSTHNILFYKEVNKST